MPEVPRPWDYLVVTASNEAQAAAYRVQLDVRQRMGMLSQAAEVLVAADPGGRRVGSGGSTLFCLEEILRLRGASDAESALGSLRILIVHAGGDSKRLPAYSPCGKIFVPLPGESDSALGATLFDRLVEPLLGLPAAAGGAGQVVVASGDALLLFDPEQFPLAAAGVTALANPAEPEDAARHGVFCLDGEANLRLYLQKPAVDVQRRLGAMDRYGRTPLDLGLMSFDAPTAALWLRTIGRAWQEREIDIYREIWCTMGSEATSEHYIAAVRASGSGWDDATLRRWFGALRTVPAAVRVVPRCTFLHFGATAQLTESGQALLGEDRLAPPEAGRLIVNCETGPGGAVSGSDVWVEACRLRAPLDLGGENVVAGVDVDQPLSLPRGCCLDVVAGRSRTGAPVFFVRCYGVRDAFKDARFRGMPLGEWFAALGAEPDAATLWDARVFPAVRSAAEYTEWLWMFDSASATPEQKRRWRDADRYSAAEIALLASLEEFHSRRAALRAAAIGRSLRRLYHYASGFSAADLAYALSHSADPAALVAALLEEARLHAGDGPSLDDFTLCRILNSLGTALAELPPIVDLEERLPAEILTWLGELGIGLDPASLRAAAFRRLNLTILNSSLSARELPRNSLRADETIWGRAPARIELAGGWTDTPPYTLEQGGDVANTAVNLNGQPPIHCYARVIEEPVVRLSSIDTGRHVEIATLEELLDYRRPGDGFALAKATLAIAGFSPEHAPWRAGVTLPEMLRAFGGGIELTTLVGIPKGSGLGTSSILGAVLVAVAERMMGRRPTPRELFHDVLRLEQALSTGGGWQDQIGGGLGGSKITSTLRGLFPDPRVHYLPDDVIDPGLNGGTTLLYYTGLTRLAKNILEQIVGNYFNRHRGTMRTLAHEHLAARAMADAMARKDAARFGYCVDVAWRLQKELCGEVTNPEIESLLAAVRPHVHGMRISGAGSGGFLFMIARSPRDASAIREKLSREPLNERSRFFEFSVNRTGLEITTC
jgi:galactokinase/mevalonate kinase-like predicted kinase